MGAGAARFTVLIGLAACASAPPPPTTPQAPAAAAATTAAAADAPLAADSGGYAAFNVSLVRATGGFVPIDYGPMVTLGLLAGFDPLEVASTRALDLDVQRPIILSWGILDAAVLSRMLAAPEPPQSFAVRFEFILPVRDVQRAAAALPALVKKSVCDRERQAAAAAGALHICTGSISDVVANALVVRADAARRELHVVMALGDGDLVSAVTAPVPRAPAALAASLRQRGFFSVRGAAAFVTPASEVRGGIALGLFMTRARMPAAPEADARRRLWRQGVAEMGGLTRMAASPPPPLFSELLIVDGTWSWGLTGDGLAFFTALGLPPDANPTELSAALARKPAGAGGDAGVFADKETLLRVVSDGGSGAMLLLRHFLWPYRLQFDAAHPDDTATLGNPPTSDWHGIGQISIDAGARRLLLRRW